MVIFDKEVFMLWQWPCKHLKSYTDEIYVFDILQHISVPKSICFQTACRSRVSGGRGDSTPPPWVYLRVINKLGCWGLRLICTYCEWTINMSTVCSIKMLPSVMCHHARIQCTQGQRIKAAFTSNWGRCSHRRDYLFLQIWTHHQ